jgi:hypothetical protein
VDGRQWTGGSGREAVEGGSRQEAACTEVKVGNSAFDVDLDVGALPIVSTKPSPDIVSESAQSL